MLVAIPFLGHNSTVMGANDLSMMYKFGAGLCFFLTILNASQYKKRPNREYFLPGACLFLAIALLGVDNDWPMILVGLFMVGVLVMLILDQLVRNAPAPREKKTYSSGPKPKKSRLDL